MCVCVWGGGRGGGCACMYVCMYAQCVCVHVCVLRMCAYAELCATCVCAVCVYTCANKGERQNYYTLSTVYLYTAVSCGVVDVYICNAETSRSS